MRVPHVVSVVVLSLLAAACKGEGRQPRATAAGTGAATPGSERGDAAGVAVAAVGAGAHADGDVHFSAATWKAPSDSAIPNGPLGASIRRGLALVTNTHDSLPRHAPGDIDCANCHIDAGRAPGAAPLTGAHARFPKYMDRTGAVVTLADRVNYCFTRSLAGTRIPDGSREMEDILAYIAFISQGVPTGARTAGARGLIDMPGDIVGDSVRGAQLYRTVCAACHGPNGEGNRAIPPGIPALWGPKSYSVGASMAREERAASFIWHNMPYGNPKSLTQQQAFDVASYINARPRPDSPGKADDWPAGGAPKDVPYDTKSGHRAYRPPARLLPRANPEGAIVPPPRSLRRAAAGGGR
ncbi:MAG: c-type cytochrome [Gemmatimonadaceae bacterium]